MIYVPRDWVGNENSMACATGTFFLGYETARVVRWAFDAVHLTGTGTGIGRGRQATAVRSVSLSSAKIFMFR